MGLVSLLILGLIIYMVVSMTKKRQLAARQQVIAR